MSLAVGSLAPDFTLPSTSGSDFSLYNNFKGKIGIIYFYPKDFSAGCTMEACSFRDAFDVLEGLDAEVIGISTDDIPTHLRFREAYNLPFHLLSDTDKIAAKKFDVLAPIIGFVQRVTFLVDENMKIAAVYQNLFDARGHIDSMIKELRRKSIRV